MTDHPSPPIPHIVDYQEAEGEDDSSEKQKPIPVVQLSSTVPFDVHDGEQPIGLREEPVTVRKRLLGSVVLLLLGVLCIAAGFWSEASSPVPGGGVPFWVIGVMLVVPGMYCIWDSLSTLRQQEKTDRQNILHAEERSSQDLS